MRKNKLIWPICCAILLSLASCNNMKVHVDCDHDFAYNVIDENFHNQVCTKCHGKKASSKEEHHFVSNQDASSRSVCSLCGYSTNTATSTVEEPKGCNHDFVIKQIDDEQHMKYCTVCGEVKSKNKHNFCKDQTRISENKDPDCVNDGYEWMVCTGCGATKKRTVPALKHDFSVVTSDTATCAAEGEVTTVCSRCNAENPTKGTSAKLEHDYTLYSEVPATCTESGLKRYICRGCLKTKEEVVNPLGHDYSDVCESFMHDYNENRFSCSCKREGCNCKRVYMYGTQVSFECSIKYRSIPTEDGDYIIEDAYYHGGDYARFWGRPIHNACELSTTGEALAKLDHTPIYDASIEGSYLEYIIDLPEPMNNAKIAVEMKPSMNLGRGELWKAIEGDWTPGLIDSAENKYPARYIVYLDGVELPLDTVNSYPSPGPVRQWFMLPTDSFDLTAGDHTIKLVMAGGYLADFYRVGFETIL